MTRLKLELSMSLDGYVAPGPDGGAAAGRGRRAAPRVDDRPGELAALDRARAAAGERDVLVAGGADVGRQYLRARLLDEIQIHLVPVLLGDGVRLFDGGAGLPKLELAGVIDSPAVTHLHYRVVDGGTG